MQADELGFATPRATLWSWPNQNPIRLADPSGRTAMRSDELFKFATSGWFGLGFSMYAKGMERRRQGIMNIPSTQGASLTDVACGSLQMNVGLAVLGEEAQMAVGAAGAIPGIVRLALLSRMASKMLHNQVPHLLASETAAAATVGAAPIRATVQNLERVANQGTLKWVVTEAGELIISPHTVGGVEVSHAVLSGGMPVRAAGHAEIAASGGHLVGMDINASSGHFGPGAVDIGRSAFEKLGVVF